MSSTHQTNPTRIEDNTFTDCAIGTYSLRADNSLILNNDFTDCDDGSVLEASVGFKHTENSYSGTNLFLGLGVRTKNLSNATNQIYKNSFEDVGFGIFSHGVTPYSNQGLSYKCNEFESNSIDRHDMVVTQGTIDRDQGYCVPLINPNANSLPAGNAISHTCSNTVSNGDIEVFEPQTAKITYAHHFEVTPATYTPDCFNSTNIFADECQAAFSNSLSCPLSFGFLGTYAVFNTRKNTVRSAYGYHKDEFGGLISEYNNALDAGSAADLMTSVDSVLDKGDSVSVYLINTANFVSDEVLEYCMYHPEGLNGDDLYKTLEAYSPLSLTLQEEISNLSGQLTNQQIMDLEEIQNGLSVRDEAENEIRFHEQQAEMALNELLSLFLYDSSLDSFNQPQDSMLVYLLDWNSNWAKEKMVNIYWQKEMYTEAQTAIDELSEEEHYGNTVILLQKLHNAFSNDTDVYALLPDTNLIDTIALDSTDMGYSLARALMMELLGKVYPTTVSYEDFNWSRSDGSSTNVSSVRDLKTIQLFPNPNNGTFNLKGLGILNNKGKEQLMLDVFDNMGKQVFEQTLAPTNEVTVKLPPSLSGVFHLKISNSEGQQFVQKLILNE